MTRATIDGNEAAVSVAYRLNEVCCIYPITPASPMAELADEWSSHEEPNIWGSVPTVVEMQSEGGAAGALHGALQGGALSTTTRCETRSGWRWASSHATVPPRECPTTEYRRAPSSAISAATSSRISSIEYAPGRSLSP